MRRTALARLTGLALLAACTVAPGRRVLAPAGHARSVTWGDRDGAGSDVRLAAELVPGSGLLLPLEMTAAVDEATSVHLEWQPLGLKDRGGWRASSSGDVVVGVHQRLLAPGGAIAAPALSATVLGVSGHGGPRAARWPGIVDRESGVFAVGAVDWGDERTALTCNLGGGVAGRPASSGHSGRLLGGLALTRALPPTGVDWSTEPARVGVETYWVYDPVDDRTFAELHAGISVWLGTVEVNVGWRRGLTSDTEDDVFYLGFRSRLFDTWSL